ncbi:MAG: trypsin-like peptidase domain-containing protein [Pirellulales bacterium]
MLRRRFAIALSFCLSLASSSSITAQPPLTSPRVTPLVEVIRNIEPGVAALFTPSGDNIFSGSGTVIHADGYILTNNHVLPKAEGFALIGKSKPMRFEVVGRLPEADIAVVKVVDAPGPLPVVEIGRSDDLLNGETVVVAGNPGGRGIVFTSGIISAKDVLEGGPNALVMTNYENSRRDRYIQFDAASNRGNSGGPLVNMEGKVIGIVSAVVNGEQNVGLAIPIDRVRNLFRAMIETEKVRELTTGIDIDPLASSASISASSENVVDKLRRNDVVLSLNGHALRHAVDWHLMLESELKTTNPLKLKVRRGSEEFELEVNPKPLHPPAGLTSEADLEQGLTYATYEGKFNALPDFSKLTPIRTGIASSLDIPTAAGDRADFFAIVYEGLIRIADDGLYRMIIASDDGSKLYIDNELLIDHDGNHPPKDAAEFVRLSKVCIRSGSSTFKATEPKLSVWRSNPAHRAQSSRSLNLR